ncbi:hypothetical protein Salat_0668600, partial [Sesamum alatum]
ERLDKAYACGHWVDLFSNAVVSHLSVSGSDHVPLLVKFHQPLAFRGRKSRPTCFEAAWIQSSQCEDVVRNGCQSSTRVGDNDLSTEINFCKLKLKLWSQAEFHRDNEETTRSERRLQAIYSTALTAESI